MFARRSRRLLTTWVALWALLGGALAPLVTHALQREAGSAWLEICTVQGTARLADDGTPAPLPEGAGLAHAMAQCALCLLQNHPGWTPPPALPQLPVPALQAQAVARAVLAVAPTQAAWTHAPSRAPPLDA